MSLAQLRQVFREAVVDRVAVIEQALIGLRDGNADARATLRRLAHTLKSSGSAYGFPDVAAAAAGVQEAPDPELPAKTQALLDLLREVLAAVPARQRLILIVDDDPMVGVLLSSILAAPGRDIVVATTWADAQRKLETLEPALVILDLMLPDADGRNALIWLREQPRTAATPIFVLSGGTAGTTPIDECLALGANRYVEKPIVPATLAQIVDAELRQASSRSGNWRVDERSGLLNRAGFKEMFEQSEARDRWIAIFGTRDGAPPSPDLLRALVSAAGDKAALGMWDTNAVVALLTGMTSDEIRKCLDDIVAALPKGSDGLRAGAAHVESAESVPETAARAAHRLARARSGNSAVVMSDERADATVLLAEDDALVSTLVIDRLKRAGMRVTLCANGAEALKQARNGRFSCAILDVKLPELDGFALLAELKKDSRTARMPVAMLTGMGQEKDVTRGFQLGADDYIVKPFSPRELAVRVQRLIDRAT